MAEWDPRDIGQLRARIERGGPARYHQVNAARSKLFARERVRVLVDDGSFVEDGLFADADATDLPAGGVITGTATLDSRPIAVVADDSTVPAGSRNPRGVEKIARTVEAAYRTRVPVVYLVDSVADRTADRAGTASSGVGRVLRGQVRASGAVPQACALFGPSVAEGAYLPALCDYVAMVDGNAALHLGGAADAWSAERAAPEEAAGARTHCSVSGGGSYLASSEHDALRAVARFLSYLPSSREGTPPPAPARAPAAVEVRAAVPADDSAFDMKRYLAGLVDAGTIFELYGAWAAELVVGFARLDGEVVGVVANNPIAGDGMLRVDSADKGARFVRLCESFHVPLLFLADVPGAAADAAAERDGILRHSARMIAAVLSATVPKISIVVRRAYGAGGYTMAGPGCGSDATLALPTARVAAAGGEGGHRPDAVRLASELAVDAVVEPENLRAELIHRFAVARRRRPLLA